MRTFRNGQAGNSDRYAAYQRPVAEQEHPEQKNVQPEAVPRKRRSARYAPDTADEAVNPEPFQTVDEEVSCDTPVFEPDTPDNNDPVSEEEYSEVQAEEMPFGDRQFEEDAEQDEPRDRLEGAQLLATNRMVCLTCTLAALLSPFAAFLIYAEKQSQAVRHHSLQSVGIAGMHLALIALCLILSSCLGAIPLVGFVVTLGCYILYGGGAILLVVCRFQLMLHAWHGLRYDIPLLGGWLRRFI